MKTSTAFCVLCEVACVLIACVSFQACFLMKPPQPTMLDVVSKQALNVQEPQPAVVLRAMSEASYLPDQFATFHIHNMPTLADVEGGLPILMTPKHRPLTGQEFVVRWLSRPVASYPQSVIDSFDPAKRVPPNYWTIPSIETHHPSIRPDLPCALLLTLTKPGEPQPIPGGRGAMLQVPPDYVLVPDRVEWIEPWNRPGVPFEFVQDAYGKMLLRISLPPRLAGITVWCQLLVADYRVDGGCVSTPMLEVCVGSR